ncbi:MAG: galactokinase family protein, partial [Oscillospiraceae bacterium]
MNTSLLKQHIKSGKLDDIFKKLYGNCDVYERFLEIIDGYNENFGDNENLMVFSAPGRTEIGGNHTDHQHGRVLAGSVNLDVIACVATNTDNIIRVFSKGHTPCEINLNCLEAIKSEEGNSTALIRGLASKISELGYKVSGFNAYTTTNVLSGSGLSSSAAFEVLISEIINNLFCQNKLSAIEIAQISQYAENVYFGKPCGLLDQTACAVGGFLSVDFKDPTAPIVTKMNFNLKEQGYKLCIINTKADHADLTDEYAAVPTEMKSVAKFFGKEFLRDVDGNEFFAKIADIRKKVSDRAVLRA